MKLVRLGSQSFQKCSLFLVRTRTGQQGVGHQSQIADRGPDLMGNIGDQLLQFLMFRLGVMPLGLHDLVQAQKPAVDAGLKRLLVVIGIRACAAFGHPVDGLAQVGSKSGQLLL